LPTQAGIHFWPDFSFVKGIRLDYLSPTLYFTDVLIILIFFFSYKNILQKLNSYKKEYSLFLLFLLFLFSGVALSKSPPAGIYGIIKFVEFIYLGLFVYHYKKSINVFASAVLLSVCIVFESSLAILQYFNQGSFQGILYLLGERAIDTNTPGVANASINGSLILRPYGTFSHPNVLGGFLVISLALVLPVVFKLRKIFITVLIFATAGIIFSFSRTALFALALYLIGFFLLSIFEKYKKGNINKDMLIKILPILLLTVFVLSLFSNSIFSRRVASISLSEESITQRTQQTNEALSMFYANPIVGVGLNNYFYHIETVYFPLGPQPVHNIFLLTLSQIGIVGFLALLLLLLKTARRNHYSFLVVATLIVLGSLDHYLLTIQQGQLILTLSTSMLLSFKLSAKIEK
jgi:O-antigen ligase